MGEHATSPVTAQATSGATAGVVSARGHNPAELSLRVHRVAIGALGMVMCPLLLLTAGLRPTPPLQPWTVLGSVSSYSYTGAGALFVGIVFTVGLALFTYRGYRESKADGRVGKVAGVAAMLVAFEPSEPPPGMKPASWWSETNSHIHYWSAAVLFVCFAVFCFWLFRRSNVPPSRKRPLEKAVRDWFSFACGVVIVVALAWTLERVRAEASIFWPEALAITAFSLSWLVKGFGSTNGDGDHVGDAYEAEPVPVSHAQDLGRGADQHVR